MGIAEILNITLYNCIQKILLIKNIHMLLNSQ